MIILFRISWMLAVIRSTYEWWTQEISYGIPHSMHRALELQGIMCPVSRTGPRLSSSVLCLLSLPCFWVHSSARNEAVFISVPLQLFRIPHHQTHLLIFHIITRRRICSMILLEWICWISVCKILENMKC
jgi:hypothetical protein